MKKVFEGPVPLSESSLFKYIRSFYSHFGQEAWSHHGLPTHITSNSAIAKSYALLIAAWVQDAAVDRTEPVYVWELGAGMGRLGFGVSRHYERLRQAMDLPRMVYVITDFVEANVDAMQANPGIAEEIAAGRMDAAQLDAINLAPPHLRHAKRTLDPRDLKNPIGVVANYVIDSLPTDAFWIKGGRVLEAMVSLASEEVPNWTEKETWGDIDIRVTYAAQMGERYDGDIADRVLHAYSRLDDCSVNLPHAGLRCVDTLQRWSKPDMLLLSADKAYVHFDELRGHTDFHVAHHASVSLMSNFHAFTLAASTWNGAAWVSPLREARVAYLALRCNLHERRAFDAAWAREIDDFSPSDKHALVWHTPLDALELPELLSLVRLGGEDPLAFGRIAPAILARMNEGNIRTAMDLAAMVTRASDVYLHLPFDETFVHATSELLAKLGMREEHARFNAQMRARCGPALYARAHDVQ